MYLEALAFEEELEHSFEPSIAFPYFEDLVVFFLNSEWSFRHRSERSVNKVELRKMLAILKANQRTHPEGDELHEKPWEVFLCKYCESVFDFR